MPNLVSFDNFSLDLDSGELSNDNRPVKLHPQPTQLLVLLVRNAGEVVSREEIKKHLWPDENTFVDYDMGINSCIRQVRAALENHAGNHRYIETVPKQGYRFTITVRDGAASSTRAGNRRLVVAGLVTGVVSAIGVAWWFSQQEVNLAANVKTSPLTTYPGMERDPALSPDGDQIAFVWNGGEDGRSHLYVKLIGLGEPLQLTDEDADDLCPAWSPDGQRIAFLREVREPGEPPMNEVLVIPALGGMTRKLGTTRVVRTAGPPRTPGLDWSPDGRTLAVADIDGDAGIFLISMETGEKTRLTTSPELHLDGQPAFSPDGTQIAFIRGEGLKGYRIFRTPLDVGEPTLLVERDDLFQDLDWTSDGSKIVYASGLQSSGALWEVDSDGGTPRRIATDRAETVSLAPSGDRLVYSQFPYYDCDLWRVPGPASTEKGEPEKWIASTLIDWAPVYSPDGTKVAFVSARSGSNQIWTCNEDGSGCVQVSSLRAAVSPRWSPDGRSIAFEGDEGRDKNIYMVEIEGGFTHRLLDDPSEERFPSWSHDGQWVYFASRRSGDTQVWKVPPTGGEPALATPGQASQLLESEDGEWLYFTRPQQGSFRDIWKQPVAGGAESLVLEDQVWRGHYWTLWQDDIVALHPVAEGRMAVDRFSSSTTEVTRLAELPKSFYCQGMTVSPDGRWMAFSYTDQGRSSDIMMLESFR